MDTLPHTQTHAHKRTRCVAPGWSVSSLPSTSSVRARCSARRCVRLSARAAALHPDAPILSHSAGGRRVRLQPALGARIHLCQRACLPRFLRAVARRRAASPATVLLSVLASRASSCRVLRSPRAAAVHSRQGGRARGYCGRGCRVSAQARRRGGCRSRNRTASSTAAAQVTNMSLLVLSVLQQCRYSQ